MPRMKQTRFLLSSFAIGAVAAFSSAGVLDYVYFEQAVEAREAAMTGTYREARKWNDDYMNLRLSEETQKAHVWALSRAEADADARAEARANANARAADRVDARVIALADELKLAHELAELRLALLDTKNRQLRELAYRERQFADEGNAGTRRVSRNVPTEIQPVVVASNSDVASHAALRGQLPEPDSAQLAAMRAEFARRIVAEAEARKKPKGPVYLNTPQGRVVLVPAG